MKPFAMLFLPAVLLWTAMPCATAGDAIKRERVVAVPDACAWPNLQLLPSGDILAFVFNQPCHGAWEGDIDCWASDDGGRTWKKRGTPASHEPGTNRMNIAVGQAANGDLVVLASGYGDRPAPYDGGPYSKGPFTLPLPNWICRSSDHGKTWTHTVMPFPADIPLLVPYGDIVRSPDGTLTAAFYGKTKMQLAEARIARADTVMFFATSKDHGKTWIDVRQAKIIPTASQDFEPYINEPALLALDARHWLCAARGRRGGDVKDGKYVHLYASDDAGATWKFRANLSEPFQYPSHLLRLADGRILLAYGSRTKKLHGVVYRVGKYEGKTWDEPRTLIDFGRTKDIDCGYPASVQLRDGTIVTAYYVGTKAEPRWSYHMGAVRWQLPK